MVCYTWAMNSRYLYAALALLAATALPATARGVNPMAYHVVYHGKDLGTWDTLSLGSSKHGTYDGSMFDSSNGPGFLTIALTRPASSEDGKSLFSSLPAGNDPLVVTALRDGKPNGVTTCPKSSASDFGIDDPKGTETITFACTAVSTE
jgi:hypothetical protein